LTILIEHLVRSDELLVRSSCQKKRTHYHHAVPTTPIQVVVDIGVKNQGF